MTPHLKPITILMADDDPEDCMLAERAFKQSRLANDLRFVHDGEELLQYLRRQDRYASPADAPLPGLLLLDLNMPRMSGMEALREIKSDSRLRRIPVVVLTTSQAEEDIYRTYDLGVSAFVTKPVSFTGLVSAITAMSAFYLEVVALPLEPDLPGT
jgi:CheY-like chemotaxis protein